MNKRLKEAKAEYQALIHSWEFAYAMGHGCSIDGSHPTFVAIRRKADDLKAIIREHETTV
jgi:hypothetical protein